MTLDLGLPGLLADLVPPTAVPDPRTSPPLRWGIVGAGGIARKFTANAREGTASRVVAVGSRDLARAESFAAEEGVQTAVGSYTELVAREDVDAVYVATPHSGHRDAALLAIAAGKHVLVEKAFARNAREGREVVQAAQVAGVFVMEAMWTRFLPHQVAARAIISSGAIGEVVEVVADHGQALTHVPRLMDPELAGGALLDLGVYPISFIHSILGTPRQVHAEGTRTATGVDETSVTQLAYDRVLAVATTTLRSLTPTRAWVGGTDGLVEFDCGFFAPGGLTVRLGSREVRWDGAPTVGGFEFQIAEVARCVAEGRTESEILPLAQSVAVLETMDEIRRQLGVAFPGE